MNHCRGVCRVLVVLLSAGLGGVISYTVQLRMIEAGVLFSSPCKDTLGTADMCAAARPSPGLVVVGAFLFATLFILIIRRGKNRLPPAATVVYGTLEDLPGVDEKVKRDAGLPPRDPL